MEIKNKRRRGYQSVFEVDEHTGEIKTEIHSFSGKKLNYTMLHKPNIEIYKKLSGGANKLMLVLLDKYIEMGTNRITCMKEDARIELSCSYPTLLGYWKELENEGVIVKNGRWHYINPEIAMYGSHVKVNGESEKPKEK